MLVIVWDRCVIVEKALPFNNNHAELKWREVYCSCESFYQLGRHGHVPSAHAINTWVRNLEETGPVLKKKPSGGVRTSRRYS